MSATSSTLRGSTTSLWFSCAVASQLCLGIYLELCLWVPLGTWNEENTFTEIPISVAVGVIVFGLAAILFSLSFLKRIRPLMWLGLGFHSLWLATQVLQWWVPYVFGASPQHMEDYNTYFGQTYKFLPSFENHPAPDGMHVVLHLLLVAVIVSSAGALLRSRQQERGSFSV